MTSTQWALGTRGWVGAYLTTMRPYLFFVSGAAGLAGEALVAGPSPIRRLVVFVPLFLAYGFGQALTDTFQIDTDSVSAPYRPLVRGQIGIRAVRWTSLAGLAASSLLLCALSRWVLIPAVLAVLGLLAYTPCKRRYWAGPPVMHWSSRYCRT
ncbi:MAG TPA: UbiA family prenyltransferase [Polyangiaceae bacterium]